MNRLNRLHAEQQQVCSSIWGQQLRTSGHQTESSSVLQEDRIYPSIEVVAPKWTNASPYNSRVDTQALPHEATCRPASRSCWQKSTRCGWKAIPKRKDNNGNGSKYGHGCPNPRDKELPPVQERRRRRDEAEVESRMASRSYLGATPI